MFNLKTKYVERENSKENQITDMKWVEKPSQVDLEEENRNDLESWRNLAMLPKS